MSSEAHEPCAIRAAVIVDTGWICRVCNAQFALPAGVEPCACPLCTCVFTVLLINGEYKHK